MLNFQSERAQQQYTSVLFLTLLHGIRTLPIARHHGHRVVHGTQIPHLRIRQRCQSGSVRQETVKEGGVNGDAH